ncbi:MAG: hypothetical protein ACI8VE_002136, partial [Natrialbaceae archaeon]
QIIRDEYVCSYHGFLETDEESQSPENDE